MYVKVKPKSLAVGQGVRLNPETGIVLGGWWAYLNPRIKTMALDQGMRVGLVIGIVLDGWLV